MTELLRAVVDTQALRSNLRVIRERAGGARVMAVVKANAYGHGLLPVARALAEADGFAAARLEEGIALRKAGITKAIILLEGVFSAEQLDAAGAHGLEVVVHHASQLEILELAARRGKASEFTGVVWLKLDTGMNRLGFRAEEFGAALAKLRGLPIPPREIRVLTHLACADEPDSPMTARQVASFRRVTDGLGLVTSIANSAGVLAWPGETRATGALRAWVRPGLALYGVSPLPGQSAADLGLRAVMRFETTVIATRDVPAGESVGYGGTWEARRPTRLAILAAGYGDGVPWGLAPGSPVLFEGRRAPIVGRVSMDMIAVDVTELGTVHPGTTALLWGGGLPIEEVAAHARTIPYTLLCAVSLRVPREYLGVPREAF